MLLEKLSFLLKVCLHHTLGIILLLLSSLLDEYLASTIRETGDGAEDDSQLVKDFESALDVKKDATQKRDECKITYFRMNTKWFSNYWLLSFLLSCVLKVICLSRHIKRCHVF